MGNTSSPPYALVDIVIAFESFEYDGFLVVDVVVVGVYSVLPCQLRSFWCAKSPS